MPKFWLRDQLSKLLFLTFWAYLLHLSFYSSSGIMMKVVAFVIMISSPLCFLRNLFFDTFINMQGFLLLQTIPPLFCDDRHFWTNSMFLNIWIKTVMHLHAHLFILCSEGKAFSLCRFPNLLCRVLGWSLRVWTTS